MTRGFLVAFSLMDNNINELKPRKSSAVLRVGRQDARGEPQVNSCRPKRTLVQNLFGIPEHHIGDNIDSVQVLRIRGFCALPMHERVDRPQPHHPNPLNPQNRPLHLRDVQIQDRLRSRQENIMHYISTILRLLPER